MPYSPEYMPLGAGGADEDHGGPVVSKPEDVGRDGTRPAAPGACLSYRGSFICGALAGLATTYYFKGGRGEGPAV